MRPSAESWAELPNLEQNHNELYSGAATGVRGSASKLSFTRKGLDPPLSMDLGPLLVTAH